ncbi:MAG: hypothetical protein ABEH43_02860, partial [Flavobacteriales bacterium]
PYKGELKKWLNYSSDCFQGPKIANIIKSHLTKYFSVSDLEMSKSSEVIQKSVPHYEQLRNSIRANQMKFLTSSLEQIQALNKWIDFSDHYPYNPKDLEPGKYWGFKEFERVILEMRIKGLLDSVDKKIS